MEKGNWKLEIGNWKFQFLLITIFIVFFIYSGSLFRGWQGFDERLYFNEELFPIPQSLSEIPEIISAFVLDCHIISANSFFSNHLTLRTVPLGSSFLVFVFYFFKKNAFLYHLLQLGVHLVNTVLVWIIFNRAESWELRAEKEQKTKHRNRKYFLVSLFTLMWSLHSGSSEAILLVTNWPTILTYTFCFGFILYEMQSASKEHRTSNFPRSFILVSILFLLTMYFSDYAYTFPVIILFFLLSQAKQKSLPLHYPFIRSVPYFLGLTIYLAVSLTKSNSSLISLFSPLNSCLSPFWSFLERNLWLTPQIFIHFIKLLLFPINLSLFQSNLIHFSNSLLEPYSVFCTLIYLTFLLTPLILFIVFRKESFSFIFPLIYAFYFSLFPFLQVLTPTYCIMADRYCYFPYFFLLVVFYKIVMVLLNKTNYKRINLVLITLCLITIFFSVRTLLRTLDWKDTYTIYKSALNIENNPLYRGHLLNIIANNIGTKSQILLEKNLEVSLNESNIALKQLKSLKEKNYEQPLTLRLYGLDFDSLIQKAAYSIAVIKNDNYQEPPNNVLDFFEPYIENHIETASNSEIILYYEILLKDKQLDKARKILEIGLKKFPYSADIMNSLIELYWEQEKNLLKGYELLRRAYKFFPNQSRFLYKLLKYYEVKNDLENQAKFSYLIGLREHSIKSYQKAAEIYLKLNNLKLVEKILKKLILLNPNDEITYTLRKKYLDLNLKTN